MNKIHLVILLLALMFSTTAKADTWPPPTARIISSSDGAAAIKVVPPPNSFSESTGTVFRLKPDGSEEIVWSQKLVNIPVSVFVWQGYMSGPKPTTRVVTLDSWGGMGIKHALVAYNDKGEVILDAELEDLLTPEEIKKHVFYTSTSRGWRDNEISTEFDGIGDSPRFIIKLSWGKVITVNLKDGEIQTSITKPN